MFPVFFSFFASSFYVVNKNTLPSSSSVCVCSDVCFCVGDLCMLPDVSVCWALNINVDKIKNPCG